MKDGKINFRILFRSPKYPVIVIAKDDIWPAFNLKELGKICIISKPGDDSKYIKVIDCSGEEFWYLPEQIVLAPAFMSKKWTKRQIIELFNHSRTAKERNLQYSLKSLSNKRLPIIIADICNILGHNRSVHVTAQMPRSGELSVGIRK